MHIYVCLKHVPDTSASITLKGQADYESGALKFVANPYDEYAVEEAVQLVEKNGSGEVVLVSLGPGEALTTLRSALAMGAHRGLLVKCAGKSLDGKTTARALHAAISQDGAPDLILTGKVAVDTEGGQTAYRLARLFDLPVVSEVSVLSLDKGTALAERERGGRHQGSPGDADSLRDRCHQGPERTPLSQISRHHEGQEKGKSENSPALA